MATLMLGAAASAGTAATATTAATAATAATTGLFGTAGAFAATQTIGTLATAASLASAAGAAKSSQAQYQASNYNAALATQEGQAKADRIRQDSTRQIGRIRSSIAKSGVTSEGTPLMVLAESASMGELDALNAEWSATNESNLYKSKARSERTAGAFSVGSSLLTGASQYVGRSIK